MASHALSDASLKNIFLKLNSHLRDLHSFPTRRSSDLGTLNIAAGTTFDIQNDQTIAWTGNTAIINNAGTFQKSAGTGTTRSEERRVGKSEDVGSLGHTGTKTLTVGTSKGCSYITGVRV